MERTDVELIAATRDGDQDAFAELVSRYKKLVYSVVFRMLGGKEDVNDAAQDVFLRIYRSLDRYSPEFKFSTWSVKIATNLCLDILRKKKPEQVDIDEVVSLADHGDSPESSYIKQEQSQLIQNAINSLPDKYRVPIVLYHQQELSYDEIAAALGEPMSIVKNRLYRARLLLREKLAECRKEGVL